MFSIKKTLLLVVDVQGKLAYLMHDKDKLFKNIQGLIQAARILEIPVIYTEQVPEKIGKTIPEIAQFLPNQNPVEKASFSCWAEEALQRKIRSFMKKEIIVCGIETHVCVYQTVSDLIDQSYKVQVVADAVSSRTEENRNYALDRMKSIGGGLTSTEMIITELIKTSQHPKFKEILNLIR